MGGRSGARPVLDEHGPQALAGHVRQLVLGDQGHLGVLLRRRLREGAAERQGGDKQQKGSEQKMRFMEPPLVGGCGSGSCL